MTLDCLSAKGVVRGTMRTFTDWSAEAEFIARSAESGHFLTRELHINMRYLKI